jgi:hypothetical protein
MFVGYDERSKGYCHFNPLTKWVIVSKDVVFDEHSIRLSSSLVAIVKKLSTSSSTIPLGLFHDDEAIGPQPLEFVITRMDASSKIQANISSDE